MTQPTARPQQLEELVRRFASAVRGAQLYSSDHPLIGRNTEALREALAQLHADQPSVAIGLVGKEVVVADTPLARASSTMGELITRLKANKIERITFEKGVTAAELVDFTRALGALSPRPEPTAEPPDARWSFPHIRVGRISADEQDQADGIASDMETIRRLYNEAVATSEATWDTAFTEGMPDVAASRKVVDGLADAVTQNRTALVALTAMKNYDNYTFTHMVNVSILTMAQARALGIEGRLLREFGLSALMHDIGKVRTPKDILNKPAKLTDEEFAIMKRHTVDGAEILRRTPEMPILAPVVAFEHHLRRDGTGEVVVVFIIGRR